MPLWISQQGVVACGKNGHGGFYLERLVERDTKLGKASDEHLTPLDHWMRINPLEVERLGLSCETCQEEPRADRPDEED